MDILGIGKMVAGVVNGFGDRKLKKAEIKNALHMKQLEGIQNLDASIAAQAISQMDINKQEAAHKSIFVAGWRPFIGWVCGISLAYNFIVYPIVKSMYPDLPELETGDLMTVLLGMLGLGGLRTYEKVKDKASDQ